MTAADIAAQLQLDCCAADPQVSLDAMRLIEEARDWLADCTWQDMDPEEFDSLGTLALVQGVERHYEGGWYAFSRPLDREHRR